eukprot:Pgem_evm1s6345
MNIDNFKNSVNNVNSDNFNNTNNSSSNYKIIDNNFHYNDRDSNTPPTKKQIIKPPSLLTILSECELDHLD